MSEWWTYRPSDFLMFSPRIYWRLFESLNQALWPLQLLGVGVMLAWLALGRRHLRAALLFVAACWALVAWAFLLQRFAPINWVASGFAVAFALQAAGLVMLAAIGGVAEQTAGLSRRVGSALMLWALLGHPLLAWAAGRPWLQAEVFGLAPDPTAIGSLGLLLLMRCDTSTARLVVRALWPLPWLWCALSAATLWTMGSAQAAVPIAALALSGLALARR